jgi:hypothetical protein
MDQRLLLTVSLAAALMIGGSGAGAVAQSKKLSPADFHYLGAFRLPQGGERPRTFAYGGNAMTFNPEGDPSGPKDGFPGSLFITGHERMPYGELPNGDQLAEVTIPKPVISKDLGALNRASFVQKFHDVAKDKFTAFMEIPTVGMQYLNTPATGAKIHMAWGQHFQPEKPVATHAWIDPDLGRPNFRGAWNIGTRSFYSTNGYMFEIPKAWADAHVGGRYLATGRFRDGGWSGLGPALFAYRPWTDKKGTPAPPGARLEERVLLLYESSRNTDKIERNLKGYQHPDEWSGGAWITTGSGKSAVLFAGTKGTGAKYWYGFVNPAGAQLPCVYQPVVEEYTACRMADGTGCPQSDLTECANHDDMRGWWSTRFAAQFILYDPDDLARVAEGAMSPWEPQPYAVLDIDKHLFLTRSPDTDQLAGVGPQRKHRTGAVAYDRANNLLYVLEPFADDSAPVVHVWKVP